MVTIPVPRMPICTRHHVNLAGCGACQEQRRVEQDAARKRLREAAR